MLTSNILLWLILVYQIMALCGINEVSDESVLKAIIGYKNNAVRQNFSIVKAVCAHTKLLL